MMKKQSMILSVLKANKTKSKSPPPKNVVLGKFWKLIDLNTLRALIKRCSSHKCLGTACPRSYKLLLLLLSIAGVTPEEEGVGAIREFKTPCLVCHNVRGVAVRSIMTIITTMAIMAKMATTAQ